MAETAEAEAPKSNSKKTIIMIAAIVVIEAVAIVGAMMMFGGPAKVAATAETGHLPPAEDESIQELAVLDARLANNKTGVTYVYNTEVYVQVRKKHADKVKSELEQFKNEIKSEITTIWRTSEPHHFQEPKLENLNRKVTALLNERFGTDPDTHEPVVAKCVIVMGTGFRIDG